MLLFSVIGVAYCIKFCEDSSYEHSPKQHEIPKKKMKKNLERKIKMIKLNGVELATLPVEQHFD